MKSVNHIFVFISLLVTAATVTVTNGLGNVFIILGIAVSFPAFQ